MARLPNPGSDNGQWGSILNDFLSQAHDGDGTVKDGVVAAANLSATGGTDGQVLSKDSAGNGGLKWIASAGSVPDASSSVKGIVQLTGDLGGTAASPSVPGLSGKTDRSTLTTKGDIYAATASSTIARLGAGTNGQVLTADSSQSTGLRWATPSNGRFTVAAVSTGNTAAQNSTAINNALTSAVSSGLEVIIPGGTYDHQGITFPAAGPVTLRGVGYSQTVLRNTHATNASVTIAGSGGGVYCQRATISDIHFTTDTKRSSQVGMDVLLTWKLSASNINVSNHGIGVRHKASWETLYSQVLTYQCDTGWLIPDPAPYTSSSPVTMVNCSAVESAVLGLDIVDGIETLNWHGGDFSESAQGMRILGNQTRTLLFSGINFERATSDDVVVGDGSTGPTAVTFMGCRFFRTSTGTRSFRYVRGEAIIIEGSSFTNYTTAIRQDSTTGSLTIVGCSESGVTNFLDLNGTIRSNGGVMTGHPTNGISAYGGSAPSATLATSRATQWAATQTLYGAGKITVSDADFTITPVDGATCLVYNTSDNSIRHAVRDWGAWRVSAPYS